MDREFLASSHVGTPDPRQKNPPKGQRLLIAWDFPRSLFREELSLKATVRLWDQTEKVFFIPLERKRDAVALSFPCDKILTYQVQVFNREKEEIEKWDHQFWTPLIELR